MEAVKIVEIFEYFVFMKSELVLAAADSVSLSVWPVKSSQISI